METERGGGNNKKRRYNRNKVGAISNYRPVDIRIWYFSFLIDFAGRLGKIN